MYVQNTKVQKEAKLKCTYREPTTARGPPWTSYSYAELDLIINKQRWKNSILNVQSDPMANVDSDHYPVWANYRTKLRKLKGHEQGRTRYHEPTLTEKHDFNKKAREEMDNTEGGQLERWTKAIQEAAKSALRPVQKQETKQQLRDSTWELIA